MKPVYALLFLHAVCAASLAGNPPLGSLGRVFYSTNVDLVWSAPTNSSPSALWVYRVLPSEFSPALISNLIAVGSFTEKDRDRTKSLNPVFDRPDSIRFRSPDQTRELGIFSNLGWVYYSDSEADNTHITQGVPKNEKATLKSAIKLLPKLGVNRSQLAHKPRSSDLQVYYSKTTAVLYKGLGQPAYATNVHMRGVMMARSIDGVEFLGKGTRDGCWIDFGNHGKISQIRLLWRNLKRERLYPTASPETLIKWIREGKSVWEPPPADRFIDWPAVKKLTITKITPYYFGDRHFEIQDWVCPYATLEASADTGNTNVTVYLHCPILDETKPLKTQSQRK